MKRKLLQKLVPGLCASLVLVSATSLTGCSTDTKTATTASDADKSETVYVKADASGTIHEIKVQTDLKNNGTSNEIKDFSTLKDIKNTKGNESFTQSPDGTITWENKGEDIHYEGTSTEELPVNVKISYTLDGKSIQPEDLSGKSGKLGIRFDYENTTDENVTVNTEVSMDGDGMYFGITLPNSFEEDLIVVFKGTDMLFKKALVITPAY